MVNYDSFVTRKPLECTLIVLFAILILLIPWYLYLEYRQVDVKKDVMITESFEEVMQRFSSDSDLSMDDKQILFKVEYEGNIVHWYGTLLNCQKINGFYRVNVDHLGTGFSDVVFTTSDDCSDMKKGSLIEYQMRLVDWKLTTFVGRDGIILEEVI